jgi:hypothetical protein
LGYGRSWQLLLHLLLLPSLVNRSSTGQAGRHHCPCCPCCCPCCCCFRDDVIERIEQLAYELISGVAAGQLPTLSCISTARSNIHMAPRHSTLTTKGGRGAQGLAQQGLGSSSGLTQQALGAVAAGPGYSEENDDAEYEQTGAAAAAGDQLQQQQHVLRLGSKVQTKSLMASGGAQANSIVRGGRSPSCPDCRTLMVVSVALCFTTLRVPTASVMAAKFVCSAAAGTAATCFSRAAAARPTSTTLLCCAVLFVGGMPVCSDTAAGQCSCAAEVGAQLDAAGCLLQRECVLLSASIALHTVRNSKGNCCKQTRKQPTLLEMQQQTANSAPRRALYMRCKRVSPTGFAAQQWCSV